MAGQLPFRNGGLRVINVSNPASPAAVKELEGVFAPNGIALRGSHAYLADGYGGLRIVNTAATPMTLTATINTPGFAEWVAIKDQTAYVADGASGVAVIDISNPAQPVLVAQYPTPSYAYKVTLHGSHVYVADGSGGLYILGEYAHRLYLPYVRR